MINRFITLCSVYIIVMIAMINVCNARSNYNNVEPQMIGSPHSKAMKQENLEDAIKIFLQEWELHHHKSEPTHSGSVSHLYQNDHPNLMSNHINSSFPLIPPNVSSSNPLMFTSNQNITDEIRTYMQSMHHINDSIPFSSAINCTRCVMHEEARSRRLETIKADILNKLGLKTAPNITSKTLPRIPHLQHLFPGYHAGMQSDSPLLFDDIYDQTHSFIHQTNQENDFEEFYVNAQRSISFAEPRKSLPYYLNLLHYYLITLTYYIITLVIILLP